SITTDAWAAGIRRTIGALGDVRTVILHDVPQPGFDVPMCLARAAWHPWLRLRCGFSPKELQTATLAAEVERRATSDLHQVQLVDLSEAIGRATLTHDVVVYRDDGHLTAHFSKSLAPLLSVAFDRLEWTARPHQGT